METIERKSSWEGQAGNTTRNPNFRRNPNLNSGKTGPDQNIRPPFQENNVEASTSNKPIEDIQINLMGSNTEQQIFLTQDDQETHDFNPFQTKSGELFDFREGYDATVYEVHKQYKLRGRTVVVPEPSKPRDTKQPKKIKDKTALTESPLETDLNTKQPSFQDISDLQPLKNQPSTSIPSKEIPKNPLESNEKTGSAQNSTQDEENVIENTAKKENLAGTNTRLQVEKPFNVETEIGKLKIVIPLSELAKHEVYRKQINRSLQISENRDVVNVLDDQPELIFGPEVNGKTVDGGIPSFYVSLNIHDKVLHNAMLIPVLPIT